MCLSSSFSSAGYRSSRVKGLLRLVVKVRIPGLDAPFDSMYSPSSSLGHPGNVLVSLEESDPLYLHVIFLASFVPIAFALPVLCEYTDCRWMVGAVGHIHGLHLGHLTQEKSPDPLLVLWKSAHNKWLFIEKEKEQL